MVSMNVKRIAVVMGGRSLEHAVSMESGKSVLDALDGKRFAGRAVVIGEDGLWSVLDVNDPDYAEDAVRERDQRPEDAVCVLREWGAELYFLALHGPGGEDGSIQGFLETLGCAYTASGVYASALAMDKPMAKTYLAAHGIRTPEWIVINRLDWRKNREGTADSIISALKTPCFVKTVRLGSSVGVQRADDRDELCSAIDAILEVSPDAVMVERFIDGREFSCPVIGNAGSRLRVLPLVEIIPTSARFFDYDAKYVPGGAEEICDPDLDPDIAREIREIALRIHELVGARGFSRSDFILDREGIWFLEINTIPGLTEQSIIPRAAEEDGISFTDLVTRIIEFALPDESGRFAT